MALTVLFVLSSIESVWEGGHTCGGLAFGRGQEADQDQRCSEPSYGYCVSNLQVLPVIFVGGGDTCGGLPFGRGQDADQDQRCSEQLRCRRCQSEKVCERECVCECV